MQIIFKRDDGFGFNIGDNCAARAMQRELEAAGYTPTMIKMIGPVRDLLVRYG